MSNTTTENRARITYTSDACASDESQRWIPDTIYAIQGSKEGESRFFWSPDGEGRHFHETLEALREDSGL